MTTVYTHAPRFVSVRALPSETVPGLVAVTFGDVTITSSDAAELLELVRQAGEGLEAVIDLRDRSGREVDGSIDYGELPTAGELEELGRREIRFETGLGELEELEEAVSVPTQRIPVLELVEGDRMRIEGRWLLVEGWSRPSSEPPSVLVWLTGGARALFGLEEIVLVAARPGSLR